MKSKTISKHKQKWLAREKRLYKTYGITGKEWELKFIEQNGVCFICEKLPKSGRLCIDHRHVRGYKKMLPQDKKKEVRGLLCTHCNKCVVGGVEHSKTPRLILEKLNEYFDKYPMKNDKVIRFKDII